MNKTKQQALNTLQKTAKTMKDMQAGLAEVGRQHNGTIRTLSRESAKEVLAALRVLYDAMAPGGSFHKLFCNVRDSLAELSEYDVNWQTEFSKEQPYDLKVDDSSEYFRGLLGGIWNPDTPFYLILDKVVSSRRVPSNPLNEAKREAKDAKKK